MVNILPQKRLLLIPVALVAAFLLAPSPIQPAQWTPPKAQALTPNLRLAGTERVALKRLHAAEDVLVDAAQRLYVSDGSRIMRVSQNGNALEALANPGGQNLGLGWLNSDVLVVANQPLGLFTLNIHNKAIRHLSTPGIRYANALAVSRDGQTVYFSQSSNRYYGESWKYLYDLLEAKPHGSLYALNLKTGRLIRLLDNLYYANGVALSPQEDYLLVNETYRYRIHRHWLKGPKAGQHDIFADNLPGFPDGLSLDPKTGHYLAAMYTVRNPVVDWLHQYPYLKAQLAKLPRFLWPKPKHYGLVAAFDSTGQIVETFQDPGGKIFAVSSARRVNNTLYLGSLHGGFVGRLPLPDATLSIHPTKPN